MYVSVQMAEVHKRGIIRTLDDRFGTMCQLLFNDVHLSDEEGLRTHYLGILCDLRRGNNVSRRQYFVPFSRQVTSI